MLCEDCGAFVPRRTGRRGPKNPARPARPRREAKRNRRIATEIIADAHDEDERAMGWYSYLEDVLVFPFTARCTAKRAVSPLQVGDEVDIGGMAPADECRHEVFVMTRWERDGLAIPLSQLRPVAHTDAKTREGVEDWLYWVERGYRF